MSPPEHIPYTIVTQEQDVVLGQNGRFVDVMKVTFQGPSGVVGHIELPIGAYSVHAVDAAVQQRLAQIEAVHRLGQAPASVMHPPAKH